MRLDSSRRLTLVFLVVLVPAAATLVWLGMQIVEQDRVLWAQRDRERQEAATDAVVRQLELTLAAAERRASRGEPIEGTVRVTRGATHVRLEPSVLRAWVPSPASLPQADDATFGPGETLEISKRDPRSALAWYGRLIQSPDAAVRAGALLRSARVHRNAERIEEALADYRAVMQLPRVALLGIPADLMGRRALCGLLASSRRAEELRREADALERLFRQGRWALDREAWELVAHDLGTWRGAAYAATPGQRAVSQAAEWLAASALDSVGRSVVATDDGPVTVVWRKDGGSLDALAAPPGAVSRWLDESKRTSRLQVALLDANARLVAGDQVGTSGVARRLSVDTKLPWTVVAAPGPDWSSGTDLPARRRMLAVGLAALGILLAGGTYLLWHLVQRELAVARLQAEFVSAVSHEFRTPVTSLRHVIELLEEDDELTRERRRSFYAVLSRSTERLHRLVESLLDFGRMEDGRRPYVLRALDPGALASEVAAEFSRDAAARGYQVNVTVDPETPPTIQADREAIGHALWNLLDNAVKYSPDARVVNLAVGPHRDGVGIAVRDEGLGIPRRERGEIFLKFVRGSRAGALGIKGTGVGLAIVTHIVRAHGGRVELESEEGKGSTFRLILPATS